MSSSPLSPRTELENQYRLLEIEYAYEKELYQQRSRAGGIYRNTEMGYSWYPVETGRSYYNSLNLPVVEISKQEGDENEHQFEPGRPVCFFVPDSSGKQKYFSFTGTVSYVHENLMVVILPDLRFAAVLQQIAGPGVQLYFDETSYRTMFAALKETLRAEGNRTAQLREILLGRQPAGFHTHFPVGFPWLNSRQDSAVNRVLAARDTAVVHGPPGTVKTTTLVEAIYETLHRESQVMVCAQSNTAVDWIAEKLTDRGIDVLRIGNHARVNDKMLSFTYEKRFESHPEYPELWSLRKAIREGLSQLRKRNQPQRGGIRDKISRWRERAAGLEIQINRELFDRSRVIACTLVGAANKVLENKQFSTLFIDEAAQALEAACWIAVNKCSRVIFAGDHCQLPPTIKCPEAARGGLDITLMQKVAERQAASVSLLEMQYRMHEDIMRFPSRCFYRDRLVAAPEVKDRYLPGAGAAMEWVDDEEGASQEETAENSHSRQNRSEAERLMFRLKEFICSIGEGRVLDERIDFGLISPYKAQIRLLRQLLKREPFFRPYRSLISVNTVDGFQGQERDVVLISLVRANEEGKIGFLKDLRRMNVAITRARIKLILIGSRHTLARHPFYRELDEYIRTLTQ